jgi:cytochrome c oxidase subunit 4
MSATDTAHTSEADHTPHDNGHDTGHGHGPSDRSYVVIALILSVMTAAEVTLSYIDVGPLFLPALLILMAAKFWTVVSYFMHLKFDNKIFTAMFYAGVGLAIFVYSAALLTFKFFNPS